MKFPHHTYVLGLLHTMPATRCTPEEGVAAWDHMFDYIHAHFPVPDSAYLENGDWPQFNVSMKDMAADCNTLLQMPRSEFEAKLESLPPYFCNILFPCAVARYMLREACLNMNHRNTRTFREFHRRYGTLILY